MAKTIKFKPKAKQDLKTIYKYSIKNWGVARADKYIRDLETALENLSENRLSAKDAGYTKPGILSYKVVSHIVFFSKNPDGIEIVRILHKSMDHKHHI